jgi:hypothetical protein
VKLPKINPRSGIPQVYIRETNLERYPEIVERVLRQSGLNSETAGKEEHLQFWFAHCLGLKTPDPGNSAPGKGWYFDFSVKKVNKAEDASISDLSLLDLVVTALTAVLLPAAVKLEGRLVDIASGRILAKKKLSNTVTPKTYRSSDGPPALPLIKHGALRLLNDLEKKALKCIANTAS